jgi:hypothetical protein
LHVEAKFDETGKMVVIVVPAPREKPRDQVATESTSVANHACRTLRLGHGPDDLRVSRAASALGRHRWADRLPKGVKATNAVHASWSRSTGRLRPRFDYNPMGSFASLILADAAERVRTQMTAQIPSMFPGDWTNVFSDAIDPSGLMSLTVTNNASDRMTGVMGAGSYVQISAVIPEPGNVALMIPGLGIVGAVARKRQSRA